MPKIQEYGSPDQMDTPQLQSANMHPTESAKTLQNIGSEITQFGHANYQRQAQSEVSELNADFAEARSDWATELEKATRDGTISTEQARTKYQEYVSKMDQNINTREGREFFDRQSSRLGGYITKSAAHGQAIASGEKALNEQMVSMTLDGDLLQRRPGDFNDIYQAKMDAIDAQVATGPISQKVGDALKLKVGEHYAQNAVRGVLLNNPYEAKKQLDNGTWDQHLDPDAKFSLRERADAEIKSRQDRAEKLLELKDKNPMQYLIKIGEHPKPLSLGEDAARSFNDRAEWVDAMKKKHGITNLPIVAEHEAEHFAKTFQEAPPDQAVAAFNNLDQNVNDKVKAQFGMQIFKKEPGLAAAMMIGADSPQDSRAILSGMSLLRKGGDGSRAIKPPKESSVEEEFDRYVGEGIEDADTRRAAREAINAHMVKTQFDKGDTDFTDVKRSAFEDSAEKVLGPKIAINNRRTMSFRNKDGKFLDQDQMSDMVHSLTDEKVDRVQHDVPRVRPGGESINLQKSRNRISLKSSGDGLYFLLLDGKPTWSKDTKKPFELNLKKIDKDGRAYQTLNQNAFGNVGL